MYSRRANRQPERSSHPDSTADRLGDELSCAVLDKLNPKLDLFVRRSNSIDPIHKHLQKGRMTVLTEDPNLHLV